ncbi:hypothetical protein NT90_00800 [Acinetobacter baumannii]|uniref:Antirestriction protein ArdA n=1 Tax=Acinetobacter seifertii TaxID=1530123 RepID=A0A7H2YXT7_9GAMM|nr:hypothetical protein NT90_00800 [Acinetobacter baumannii]QNX09387.1 hypothetical protein IC795_03770 [Acinetobacter seifertii]QNY17921.1 hypothetical protein IC765_04050 [Acinetobacter seifertii]
MGISAGGLVVPFNGTLENAIELVSGWKNRTINVVSLTERADFDTRYDNCISLKIFNNVLIIYHADFLFSAMDDHSLWAKRFKESNLTEWVLFFAAYDSGGTYGYSFFQYGEFVRSVFQMVDDFKMEGKLSELEQKIINAPVFFEYFNEEDESEYLDLEGLKANDLLDANGDIQEWADCYKCYYFEDEYVAEHDLAFRFLSEMVIEYVGCDFLYDTEHDQIYLEVIQDY